MDKNNLRIILFTGEKEKECIWSGTLIARSVIKGYDVLLTGDYKMPADDVRKKKQKYFLN